MFGDFDDAEPLGDQAMASSIQLWGTQRKALLQLYRKHAAPAVRLRAHIILLLADGHAWAVITALLFCSSRTIDRWQSRFRRGGVAALTDSHYGTSPRIQQWAQTAVRWVTRRSPRDFGLLRSRWCCAAVVLLLWEICAVRVGRESVRGWLHRAQLVWRRPRPVLGPHDPEREAKLQGLRQLLATLPAEEVAVFQDEVDINTNPKLGGMWMRRGQQAGVATPGTNAKRYLGGALNWRTGALVLTEGAKRDGELFVRHLDDLRWHLRRYRVIHVICDNARFHDPSRCRRVQDYLARWGHRVRLHYLPKYAPDTNPLERVWWHLHDEITRNHRCRGLEELLDLVFAWLEDRAPFRVETSVYTPAPAA
jgi:transposase